MNYFFILFFFEEEGIILFFYIFEYYHRILSYIYIFVPPLQITMKSSFDRTFLFDEEDGREGRNTRY
jgi:hypothetical protein